MSDFFKKFLLEDARKFSAGARHVALAAFGKHPGWDDHVEDLGLETESLNLAKTVLYVNGIGGQIDSGEWEKLDAAQQLPAFKHLFVWQRGGQFLIGRLWSSSDGKGRTRYPMVVCLHFIGVPLGWALKQALPALAELEEGCVKTTSAEDVRGLLSRQRAALREAIQSADGRGEYAPVTPDALHKILQTVGDAKFEGFLRVLYQVQSQLGAFSARKFNEHADPAAIRARQIRVPFAGENPEQALLFWTRLFLSNVDASVPLLMTLPLEGGWVDVTAGEPESHEFFCLRASPSAVPMVSEIPYQLDDAFRTKAVAFLEGVKRGEMTAADLRPPTAIAPPGDAPAPAKGGWLKWLGAGVVVIIGAVVAILSIPRIDRQEVNVNASNAKPQVAKPVATVEVATSASTAADAVKAEAARVKARRDAEAEAARLVEEKQKSDAMAAAARLKAEAEAAAKAKERQIAEAARLAKEKEAATRKELEDKERKAAELAQIERARNAAEAAAKKKAEEEARAKAELAAASTPKATDPKPAEKLAQSGAPVQAEMTNSIGMILVPVGATMWVGKYEVTRAEYEKVMSNHSSGAGNERQPIVRVAWNDANEFCRKLTQMERDKLPAGKVYTLPTEKQWEEFLGGQRFEDLPGGGRTGKGAPAIVGQSGPPNKFGLFDVLGNVWEWCRDGATGDEKLLKGGAFNSANTNRTLLPDVKVSNCGFRCILAAQ